MPQFPSEIPFASFLQYSPKGVSPMSVQSQVFVRTVKLDKPWPLRNVNSIDYSASKIAEKINLYPSLQRFIGPEAILVPVPKSAPLVNLGGAPALWPSLRICEALQAVGMAKSVLPLITRTTPVLKSATASAENRPLPQVHYDSVSIDLAVPLEDIKTITIVDDIITKGSTFIGMYAKLKEAFPNAEILCFALVRTMSGTEVESLLDPVVGTMQYRPSNPSHPRPYFHRHP